MELTSKLGNILPGIGLEIADVVDQGINSYMPGVFAVLHTESADAMQSTYTEFTDYTGFGPRKEGENANKQERFKGFESKYVIEPFSGSVTVSYESLAYNTLAPALKEAQMRGRDAMRFKDKHGYQLFNKGFDTAPATVEVSGQATLIHWFNDTKPQFSVAHPSVVPGGSSQSNASATNIALSSEDQLEVAKLALEFQTQDNGELLDLQGTMTLVLPTHLEREGKVITQSAQKTGTDYNDINIYSDGTFDLAVSKYLTDKNNGSNTAWFCIDSMSHELYNIEGLPTAIEEDYNKDNRSYTYFIHSYGTVASKAWKGTWGSKGTGSGTYTA